MATSNCLPIPHPPTEWGNNQLRPSQRHSQNLCPRLPPTNASSPTCPYSRLGRHLLRLQLLGGLGCRHSHFLARHLLIARSRKPISSAFVKSAAASFSKSNGHASSACYLRAFEVQHRKIHTSCSGCNPSYMPITTIAPPKAPCWLAIVDCLPTTCRQAVVLLLLTTRERLRPTSSLPSVTFPHICIPSLFSETEFSSSHSWRSAR